MVDMLVRLYALPEGAPLRAGLAEQGVQVRPCRPFEMHAVEEWIARTFSTRWVSEFQVAMSHQPCGCIIATKDKQVVGFACFDATARGFIGPMGVDPELRQGGVGKALYKAACRYAKESRCHSVTLNVWSCNESALHFYEALGMKPQKIAMEQIL